MEKTIDGDTNPTTNFKRDFLNTRYYRVCAVKGLKAILTRILSIILF
jgi:hypothetical protein